MKRALPSWRRGRRGQRGSMAVLSMLTVLVLLGFFGMALDLGLVYNRRVELDAVAGGVALAAAQQLTGKAAGIDNALVQAGATARQLLYRHGRARIAWNDDALSFAATPDGEWVNAATARAAPAGLLFVHVDTGRLAASPGTVGLYLMRFLTPTLSSATVVSRAVAGRAGIDVAPLAVCALSATPAAGRANPGPPANVELVEFGFRRGIGYDLMQLNPNSAAAVNFVVNPFAPPGTVGAPGGTAAAVVGPYACAGQLAFARIGAGPLTVARPFPLTALHHQLNSRFNQYPGAQCTYATAPPDRNIKSYARDTVVPWMNEAPEVQGALGTTAGGKLWTIADPLPAPTGIVARQYGPLWSYARAVPFSAYVPNADEPASGYTPFNTTDWAALYAPAAPVAKSYPSGVATPYQPTSGAYFTAPPVAVKGVVNRRVLNVPLLQCPVGAASTTATVLGIGKFMMTVPATETALYAEFGGVVPEHALGGPVELYR